MLIIILFYDITNNNHNNNVKIIELHYRPGVRRKPEVHRAFF